ncbi:MAG TPA: hypothetical protein VGD74_10300 [Vulgatibacter sp.]
MKTWFRTLAIAAAAFALSTACGGEGGGGSGKDLPCAADSTSRTCADCLLKAKVDVCSEAYQSQIVACQGCEAQAATCEAALCEAKTAVLEKCWASAAKTLCGATLEPGTGGTGGSTGSGGTSGPGGSGGGEGGSGGGSGGDGGSGGSGGSGGDGGSGGSGGPCDGAICSEGEVCSVVDGEPVCGCTTSPDSCLPYGNVCVNGDCVDRPERIYDFDPCNDPGADSDDQKFICLEMTEDGDTRWIRRCSASSACPQATSYCNTDFVDTFGSGLCLLNYCGDSSVSTTTGLPLNGTNWGVCDPDVQRPTNPQSTAPKGACVVSESLDGLAFLCRHGGSRPIGSACTWNADRGSAQECVRGSVCLVNRLPSFPCASDSECGASQVCKSGTCTARGCEVDAQCGDDAFCEKHNGICTPFGTCMATCNAGTDPDTSPFGRCSVATDVCWGLVATGLNTLTTGYCAPPGCDLMGDPNQCPPVDGRPGMCRFAGWAKGERMMGQCGARYEGAAKAGEACSLDNLECEPGTLCMGVAGDYRCRPYCECPDGQWNSEGICTATTTCKGGTSCGWFGAGESMGICF